MNNPNPNHLFRALFFAPAIFICHFLEEAPGFVEWINAHVSRDITSDLFWSVNLSGLAITVAIVGFAWLARSSFSWALTIAWFSFLMLANAILHIGGSFVDRGYVPGLVTAVVLYLPYYFWLATRIAKSGQINFSVFIGAAVLGSTPMLIHGYWILFLGDRLF